MLTSTQKQLLYLFSIFSFFHVGLYQEGHLQVQEQLWVQALSALLLALIQRDQVPSLLLF